MSESYVYVIGKETEGPIKIGFSANPAKRLKQLQTAQHEELRLFYFQSVPKDIVKMMEQAIHATNRHKKVKGEWFNLTVDDAIVEVRHAIIRYSDNVASLKQKLY